MARLGLLRSATMTAALAACLGAGARAQAQAFYTIDAFPGGNGASFAFGVSPEGCTVVGWAAAPQGYQGFRWTASGGIQGIGYFENPGYQQSWAMTVSARGGMVGGMSVTPEVSGNGGAPLFWTACTGNVYLGDVGGATTEGQVSAVTHNGSRLVGSVSSDTSTSVAFVWTKQNGMSALDLPSPYTRSSAAGLSEDGSVVVGSASQGTTPNYKAAKWVNGAMELLPSNLPASVSFAHAVTADGSVIVGRDVARPARWTAAGVQNLGSLPGQPGGTIGEALAVSDDGNVVVGYQNHSSQQQMTAFIWDPVNGMRNLATVLINDYGMDLSGWSILHAARAISADGTVIAGDGVYNGMQRAWVAHLSPPPCGP